MISTMMVTAVALVFALLLAYDFKMRNLNFNTALNMLLLMLTAMVMLDLLDQGVLVIIAAGYTALILRQRRSML